MTEEVNQYDQYGEYFVYAWEHRPKKEDFEKVFLHSGGSSKNVDHVYGGGGRRNDEFNWYHFFKFIPSE